MLKAESKKELETFDVLKWVLASYKTQKNDKISASLPELHDAIYQLTKEHPDLWQDYIFEQRPHFHYCRELEIDLSNLEMAGHLSTPNPELREYGLEEKLIKSFDTYGRPNFSEDELSNFQRMADKLGSLLEN